MHSCILQNIGGYFMQNYGFNNYNPYLPQYQHQTPQQQTQQGFKLIPVTNKNEVNSFITDKFIYIEGNTFTICEMILFLSYM